jgi:hypothetical protein
MRKNKGLSESPGLIDERTRKETFANLMAAVAETGPMAMKELRDKLGGDPGPGHLIDAAMQLCATMHRSTLTGDMDKGMTAAAGALYLLWELALDQQYIVPEKKFQA